MTATSVESLTCHQWLSQQIHRTDKIGILARDIAAEERRCNRKLDANVNTRLNLLFYVNASSTYTRLTRADALEIWDAWLVEKYR